METGKVTRATRLDKDVDDALCNQANEAQDTPSAHIRKVLTAHVKKQEVKPKGKQEYNND